MVTIATFLKRKMVTELEGKNNSNTFASEELIDTFQTFTMVKYHC